MGGYSEIWYSYTNVQTTSYRVICEGHSASNGDLKEDCARKAPAHPFYSTYIKKYQYGKMVTRKLLHGKTVLQNLYR